MNCVLIVLDALDYTRVQESKKNLLPFLNSKSKNGIKVDNMYSEAPYTEAATMALYGGQHTLSNSGYLKRYQTISRLIFEAFQDNGYDVFFNALQPQCYPSSLRRGITSLYYDRGYDNHVLWSYRLSYYSKLQKEGLLDENDYKLLVEVLRDNFLEWIRFLEDIKARDISTELINELNKSYDWNSALNEVGKQYKEFEQDAYQYIYRLLEQGLRHQLFSVPYFEQIDYNISLATRVGIDERCKKIIREFGKRNLIYNLLFNRDVFRTSYYAIIDYLKNRNREQLLGSMYLVKNTLFPVHIKDRIGNKAPSLKGQPSFNKLSKHLLNWIDCRTNEKPFFACLHVDDIHFPEVFYTYDTNEINVVNEDLDVAEKFLQLRTNEPGTIIHDLSLVYADHQCEWLYKEFEKRGLDSNTIFIITADHGFSYSGYPIRNKAINTFYLENFKIPFFAFGPGIESKVYESLQSSVSIPATICDLMCIDSSGFEPKIGSKGLKSAFIEYCGGGCPDLRRRDIMLAAFDRKRMIAFKSDLNKSFDLNNIVEVYDLSVDPKQKKNLVKNYSVEMYSDLIDEVRARFIQLKSDLNCQVKKEGK